MTDVAAAVVWNDGRVLLARRGAEQKLGGLWEFPGGKLEPGEQPAEALRRELREELNLETRAVKALGTVDHAYPDGPVRLHVFEVRMEGGELALRDHDAVAWVDPWDLDGFALVPADVECARRLKRGEWEIGD